MLMHAYGCIDMNFMMDVNYSRKYNYSRVEYVACSSNFACNMLLYEIFE